VEVLLEGKSGSKYNFEGPYPDTSLLEDRSGVYAILCNVGDKLYLVDVGESSEVKSRVENHERKDCWKKNCNGTIKYAAYYIEYGKKPSRAEVEQDIRNNYSIPCGEK